MSDAAPLPRLGEVFFDVRGNSRSMRLSWYADTGVAVFSIWQAGMCTGTFRLPIGDLQRMIDTLERGPSAQGRGRAHVPAAGRGPVRGRDEYQAGEDEIGLLDSRGAAGGYAGADYGADYNRSDNRTSQYASGDGGAVHYPAADYGSASYAEPGRGDTGHDSAGYGSGSGRGDTGHSGAGYGAGSGQHGDDHDASRGSQAYGAPAYPPDGGFGGHDRDRAADYGAAGSYQPADFGPGQSDHRQPAAYDYDPAGYARGGYAEENTARHAGTPGGDYPAGSYGAAASDNLTSEYPAPGFADAGRAPGFADAGRADTGADYQPGGYGSQPSFPAGSHRRDDGLFSPDPAGAPHSGTDEAGYLDERFVPPYVRGGGESYPNDNRSGGADYAGDPDDARYRAGGPHHSQPDGYDEAQWQGEAYSSGGEYRRR